MKDLNGKEIRKGDDVYVLINGTRHRSFVRGILKNKESGEEFALTKLEWTKNGGFGSCLVNIRKSEEIEKIF